MRTNVYNTTLIENPISLTKYQKLWVLLLMLYFANFMDLGNLFPFLFLPVAFIYIINNKIHLNLVVLSAFCISYTGLLYYYNFMTDQAVLLRLISPVTLYALGYYLVSTSKSFAHSYKLIMAMILSFSIYGILCILYTSYQYGSIANSTATIGRVVKIIWTGRIIAATGLNTYLSMGFVLFPLLFIKSELIKKKPVLFILFLLCVYSTFAIGNRTGLVAVIASCVTVYFFSSPITSKKIVSSIIGSLVAVFVYIAYTANIGNIRIPIERMLVFRSSAGEFLEDPRFLVWKLAFLGLFEYPLGGGLAYTYLGGAHNTWLGVGFTTGIFPFALILLFTVYSIFSVIAFIKNNPPTELKVLVIGLTTCFLIIFMAEPILEGWTSCFNAFCFLIGIVQSLNIMMKKKILS